MIRVLSGFFIMIHGHLIKLTKTIKLLKYNLIEFKKK